MRLIDFLQDYGEAVEEEKARQAKIQKMNPPRHRPGRRR